jgi:hypothetical protein
VTVIESPGGSRRGSVKRTTVESRPKGQNGSTAVPSTFTFRT